MPLRDVLVTVTRTQELHLDGKVDVPDNIETDAELADWLTEEIDTDTGRRERVDILFAEQLNDFTLNDEAVSLDEGLFQ